MKIPTRPVSLMFKIYRDVIPLVHQYLSDWKKRASHIPDPELRHQALQSIETKKFHCEGGAIYALLAKEHLEESIKFVIAYQTISDYLDNLCDRSTSLDPADFRALHESMLHALTPEAKTVNYYRYRVEQDDGNYLNDLVKTCQAVLVKLPHYKEIAPYLLQLAGYYCDLQVYKHIEVEERIPQLKNWFEKHKIDFSEMSWYEFSACAGSTLGIFCLVSYAFHEDFDRSYFEKVKRGLFPYVQGLHILLDYFIDQEEDRNGGDLNFCFYYKDKKQLLERFKLFIKKANQNVEKLPDGEFHLLINRGLLGIYLSDKKVKHQKDVDKMAQKIMSFGGLTSRFFYLNRKFFQKVYG